MKMPRGKYIRKNKRNETALTTQLMLISLRMDDHIYNNMPVAGADAARYLQEIATLKLQCPPTNGRALQVIEKLTRLMRSILTEEDTDHASTSFYESFHINTELAGTASPVYSLPDEDRLEDIYEQNNMDLNTTCISDDDEAIQNQNNISRRHNFISAEFVTSDSSVYALTDENSRKDRQGKELDMDNLNTTHIPRDISRREMYIGEQVNLNTSNNQGYISTTPADNTISKNAFDNGEVIDITIDSDLGEAKEIPAACDKQSVTIEHVNSGISNMVIHDEGDKQKKPIDVDDNCSQSLLDNYANDNENNNGRDNVIEKKSYKEKDGKTGVINKVNNYFQKQAPLAAIYSQDIFAHATSADSESTKVTLNKDCKSLSQGVLLENNKMGMTKKAGSEKKKTKKRNTKKTLKSTKNNTAYLKDSLNATAAAKYVTNKRYNIEENRPVTVKKSRKPKKVHEIYNENVENDLSWVENIRYVREVSPSEFDPALSMLPDNFWDNFELPGEWNDAEFEV